MAGKQKWYRHRIVKRSLVTAVVSNLTPSFREKVEADLLRAAQVEMSAYLKTHYLGQILTTTFVKPHMAGAEIFVALTLYGPPSVEDEITAELAERGEA